MSNEDVADHTASEQKIGDVLQAEIEKNGPIVGKDGKPISFNYKTMANETIGAMDQRIQVDPKFRGKHLIDIHAVASNDNMIAARKVSMQAGYDADIAGALEPLARGGLLSKFITALQSSEKDDIPGLIASTFGVEKKDIQEGVLKATGNVGDARKALEKLQAAAKQAGGATPEMQKKIDAQLQVLRSSTNELNGMLLDQGFATDTGLINADDMKKAYGAWNDMSSGIHNLRHLAGASGWTATMQEKAKFTELGFNDAALGSEDQRRAIAEEVYEKREGELASDRVDQAAIDARVKQAAGALTPEEAKKQLRDEFRENRIRQLDAGKLDEAAVNKILAEKITGKEAEDVALMVRAMKPGSATEADVAKSMKDYAISGAGAGDYARRLADAEVSRKRMGISDEEVSAQETERARRAALPPGDKERIASSPLLMGNTAANYRMQAINMAMEKRVWDNFDPKDPKNFDKNWEDREKHYQGLMATPEGWQYAGQVSRGFAASSDVMTRFILDKKQYQRLGIEGIRNYETTVNAQQELTQMAYALTGGDMERLFTGTYLTNYKTEEERETYLKQIARVEHLRQQVTKGLEGLHAGMGKSGFQWGQDEKDDALAIMGFDSVADMTDKQKKDYGEMVESVKIARHLGEGDTDVLARFKKQKDALDVQMDKLHVTGDRDAWLQNARKSSSKGVSDDDRGAVNDAWKRYSDAGAGKVTAQKRLDDADAALEKFGEDDTLEPEELAKKKAAWEEKVAAEHALEDITNTRDDARQQMLDYNKRLHLGFDTVEELHNRIQGSGDEPKELQELKKKSPQEYRELQREIAQYDATAGRAEKLRQHQNLTKPEDLFKAMLAIDALDKKAGRYAEIVRRDPAGLARDMLTSFGMNAKDTKTVEKLASYMDRPEEKRAVQRIIEGNEYLNDKYLQEHGFDPSVTGRKAMADDFNKAKTEKEQEQFRQDHGHKQKDGLVVPMSAKEWTHYSGVMQMRHLAGLDDMTGDKVDVITKGLQTLHRGGEAAMRAETEKTQVQHFIIDKHEITITSDGKGHSSDMNATTTLQH
jgi:hypothetical protein